MKDIKTKPALRDIKALDKAADVTHKAKDVFVRTKGHAEPQQDNQENYVEDAGNKVKESAESGVHKTGNFTQRQGKAVIQRARRNFVNRGYTRSRARQAANSGAKTAKETGKSAVRATRKTVKTASSTARTTVKTSCTAVKTVAKTAQLSARAAQRVIQAARVAVKVAIKAIQVMVKAIIAAVKATIAAIKGLVAAIAAGGWVVLAVILVVALVAFLIASPLGIFTNGGADKAPTISDEVLTLNAELTDRLARIQKDAGQVVKTVITFNNEDNSFIDNWPDILAIFAVRIGMDPKNPMDVVVMDDQRISELRKVFWDMTSITSEISEVTPTASPTTLLSPESTTTPFPVRTLDICVNSRYWDDMPSIYNLTN